MAGRVLQAQALLRLFVNLLPGLRETALHNMPEWAALPDASEEPQAEHSTSTSKPPRHSLGSTAWPGSPLAAFSCRCMFYLRCHPCCIVTALRCLCLPMAN